LIERGTLIEWYAEQMSQAGRNKSSHYQARDLESGSVKETGNVPLEDKTSHVCGWLEAVLCSEY
jgi:hypothetical protein